MFAKENQYATVVGFGVRVKDEREADRNHIVETTFEMPLDRALADEILPAMARDLFISVGGEWTPKPELREASFNIAPAAQIMEVRSHPELSATFRAAGVGLRRILAVKSDSGAWSLRVTASWTLMVDAEAVSMIRALKTGVYLTFQVEQPALVDAGAPAAEDQQTAEVSETGNVTSLAKRRKQRKQSAEAEGQQQVEAGRALGDDTTGTVQ